MPPLKRRANDSPSIVTTKIGRTGLPPDPPASDLLLPRNVTISSGSLPPFPQRDEYPDKPTIIWNRDIVFEQTLESLGVPYRIETRYPLQRIDMGVSLSNSARPNLPNGVDQEKVDQIESRAPGYRDG